MGFSTMLLFMVTTFEAAPQKTLTFELSGSGSAYHESSYFMIGGLSLLASLDLKFDPVSISKVREFGSICKVIRLY